MKVKIKLLKIFPYMIAWLAYYLILGNHSWRALIAGVVLVILYDIINILFRDESEDE